MFPSSPLQLVSILSSSWLSPAADPAARRAAAADPVARVSRRSAAGQFNMVKLDK
jgi:hypothetical protein